MVSQFHSFTLRSILVAALTLEVAAAAPRIEARRSVSSELGRDAQLQIARSLRSGGQPELAIETYRRLLKETPTDATLQIELADVLETASLVDEAMALYEKSTAQPDFVERAIAGIMRINLRLGNFESVIEASNRLTEPSTTIQVALYKGIAFDRLLKHAEAQASYRAALMIDPRSVAARNNLALSLALTGNYRDAEETLRLLAASSDATPRIRQNLAFIYGMMGRPDLAARYGAADLSPQDVANNAQFFGALQP